MLLQKCHLRSQGQKHFGNLNIYYDFFPCLCPFYTRSFMWFHILYNSMLEHTQEVRKTGQKQKKMSWYYPSDACVFYLYREEWVDFRVFSREITLRDPLRHWESFLICGRPGLTLQCCLCRAVLKSQLGHTWLYLDIYAVPSIEIRA